MEGEGSTCLSQIVRELVTGMVFMARYPPEGDGVALPLELEDEVVSLEGQGLGNYRGKNGIDGGHAVRPDCCACFLAMPEPLGL